MQGTSETSGTGNLPITTQPLTHLSPEFFHDRNRQPFATIFVGDHLETWPITSAAFKNWLRHQYYLETGTGLPQSKLKKIVDNLGARALYDGLEHEVHVRVAHPDGAIYIDLADDPWQAVEITATGWQVVDHPGVKFIRPPGLTSLPIPVAGGTFDDLRPFINCHDNEWPLVVGWILGAYSTGPYPVLVLQGEQGSAKSTTARILKSLVDPDQSPQLTKPRSERDLQIAATNSWTLSYDNLSGLRDGLSDAFCRLATGGGMKTRKLLTDQEEIIFNVKRPIILNGIDRLLYRGDLAERAVLLTLPRIPEESRQREVDLWREFQSVRPKLFGAILDSLSAALANIHRVDLDRMPRMADFAAWVTAAEPALPWEPGTFLAAYEQNRGGVIEGSLENDPVAMAVMDLASGLGFFRDSWSGTPTRLLVTLTARAGMAGIQTAGRDWPKAANKLTERLNRLAPFLSAKGIEIESGWGARGRKITIRKRTVVTEGK